MFSEDKYFAKDCGESGHQNLEVHCYAGFRNPLNTLDNFDFNFNKKMNPSLFYLATANFIGRREDALFLGPPGTGKSHLAQALGQAAIQQGYRVLYRETHSLLDELAEASALTPT